MMYYFYIRKKQTKFVRKVAGSIAFPLLSLPLKIIKQVSRNIRTLEGEGCK